MFKRPAIRFSALIGMRGKQNNERFMKAYNTVANLIRDHIATLAIARPG